jgi:hypothetical protein
LNVEQAVRLPFQRQVELLTALQFNPGFDTSGRQAFINMRAIVQSWTAQQRLAVLNTLSVQQIGTMPWTCRQLLGQGLATELSQQPIERQWVMFDSLSAERQLELFPTGTPEQIRKTSANARANWILNSTPDQISQLSLEVREVLISTTAAAQFRQLSLPQREALFHNATFDMYRRSLQNEAGQILAPGSLHLSMLRNATAEQIASLGSEARTRLVHHVLTPETLRELPANVRIELAKLSPRQMGYLPRLHILALTDNLTSEQTLRFLGSIETGCLQHIPAERRIELIARLSKEELGQLESGRLSAMTRGFQPAEAFAFARSCSIEQVAALPREARFNVLQALNAADAGLITADSRAAWLEGLTSNRLTSLGRTFDALISEGMTPELSLAVVKSMDTPRLALLRPETCLALINSWSAEQISQLSGLQRGGLVNRLTVQQLRSISGDKALAILTGLPEPYLTGERGVGLSRQASSELFSRLNAEQIRGLTTSECSALIRRSSDTQISGLSVDQRLAILNNVQADILGGLPSSAQDALLSGLGPEQIRNLPPAKRVALINSFTRQQINGLGIDQRDALLHNLTAEQRQSINAEQLERMTRHTQGPTDPVGETRPNNRSRRLRTADLVGVPETTRAEPGTISLPVVSGERTAERMTISPELALAAERATRDQLTEAHRNYIRDSLAREMHDNELNRSRLEQNYNRTAAENAELAALRTRYADICSQLELLNSPNWRNTVRVETVTEELPAAQQPATGPRRVNLRARVSGVLLGLGLVAIATSLFPRRQESQSHGVRPAHR